MSVNSFTPNLSFDSVDPFASLIDVLKTLDQLLPVCVAKAHSTSYNSCHLRRIKLENTGTLEDPLALLSSLRNARDAIAQRQSTINHELHTAREVAKLHELRLAHATTTLNVLEETIGEVRARFRARGIPSYPPQNGSRTSNIRPAETSGAAITSGSSGVEEVSVSSSSQTCTSLSPS